VGAAQTPFSITLNQHALNLSLTAPYNQFQLVGTVRNTDGLPIPDTSTITYRATDSSVTVSASGLITSHFVTSSGLTRVIATRQADGVSLRDTAYVHVTPQAPSSPIATFSIAPVAGDSAVRQVGGLYYPDVHATDVAGQPVAFDNQTGYVYWIKSSDRSRFSYANGVTSLGKPYFSIPDTGHTTFYATSWMYGVTVQDSLKFLVGWRQGFSTSYDPDDGYLCNFYKGCGVVIAQGGVGYWFNSCDASVRDIVFDHPEAADSAPNSLGQYTGHGNIHFDGTSSCQQKLRRFPTVGTYHWHDVRNPAGVGTIYVVENLK
jgi:hypothetical protein